MPQQHAAATLPAHLKPPVALQRLRLILQALRLLPQEVRQARGAAQVLHLHVHEAASTDIQLPAVANVDSEQVARMPGSMQR